MSHASKLAVLAILLGIAALAFVGVDEKLMGAVSLSPALAMLGVGALITSAAAVFLLALGIVEVLARRRSAQREQLREQLREQFLEEAPTQPFGTAVTAEAFDHDSLRGRAAMARRVVRRALGGTLLSAFLIAPLFIGGCSKQPVVENVAAAVVKCVEKDPAELGKLEAQGEALWAKHDIASIIALALSAGELGSCMFAELTQKHTGPQTDGRAAESVDARLELSKAWEDFRAKHAGGASFRTADGEL